MLRAFFLRVSLRIDQTNRLILVDRHLHNADIIRICVERSEPIVIRQAANTSPFKRSWHFIHLIYLRRPQDTPAAPAIVHRLFS